MTRVAARMSRFEIGYSAPVLVTPRDVHLTMVRVTDVVPNQQRWDPNHPYHIVGGGQIRV